MWSYSIAQSGGYDHENLIVAVFHMFGDVSYRMSRIEWRQLVTIDPNPGSIDDSAQIEDGTSTIAYY